MFAITFEQAQRYLPPTQHPPHEHNTIAVFGGERVPTALGWVSQPRRDCGFKRPDRSWKNHRRTQCGGAKI